MRDSDFLRWPTDLDPEIRTWHTASEDTITHTMIICGWEGLSIEHVTVDGKNLYRFGFAQYGHPDSFGPDDIARAEAFDRMIAEAAP